MSVRAEDGLSFMIRPKDGTHVYYSVSLDFCLPYSEALKCTSISDIALPSAARKLA